MTEYERQYRKWFASLPPKKQAKLRAQGLDKPLDDHNQTNTPGNGDFAFATLGEDFDYGQFDEQPTLDETHVDEQAKAYGSLLLCWVFQRLQRNQTEKAYALGLVRYARVHPLTLAAHRRKPATTADFAYAA